VDPVVVAVLRGALALLFVVAAAHKLRDRGSFRTTLDAYAVLPVPLVGAIAALVPLLELAVAVLLVASRTLRWGVAGAVALLGLYALAMAVNLRRGRRDLDCGCMGPATRSKIGPELVVRNVVLIAVALACLSPVTPRPLGWLDRATVPLALATVAALYAASERLLALAPSARALRAEMRS
jgi:hypothetical protein